MAVSSAIVQWKITHKVVQAERDRPADQIRGKSSVRARERRDSQRDPVLLLRPSITAEIGASGFGGLVLHASEDYVPA